MGFDVLTKKLIKDFSNGHWSKKSGLEKKIFILVVSTCILVTMATRSLGCVDFSYAYLMPWSTCFFFTDLFLLFTCVTTCLFTYYHSWLLAPSIAFPMKYFPRPLSREAISVKIGTRIVPLFSSHSHQCEVTLELPQDVSTFVPVGVLDFDLQSSRLCLTCVFAQHEAAKSTGVLIGSPSSSCLSTFLPLFSRIWSVFCSLCLSLLHFIIAHISQFYPISSHPINISKKEWCTFYFFEKILFPIYCNLKFWSSTITHL